jgi:hypothetical protein
MKLLESKNIPDVSYSPDISKLFGFFNMNWSTLGPVLWILFGTLFAFFVLGILKKNYFGE